MTKTTVMFRSLTTLSIHIMALFTQEMML